MNLEELKALPPKTPEPHRIYGHLFLELSAVNSLIADHYDYAHDPNYRAALAARLNFWGDPGRGVFLK